MTDSICPTGQVAAAQSLRHLVLFGLVFVIALIFGRQSHLQNGAAVGVLFATVCSYPLLWVGLCRLCGNANLPGSSAKRNVSCVLLSAIGAAAAKLCLFFAPVSEGPWIALAFCSISALFFFQRYLRDVAVHFDEAKSEARCDQVLWGFVAATAISGFVIWSQPMEHTVAAMLLLVVAVVADCVLFLFGLDLTLRIAGTLESNAKAVSATD